MPLRLNNDLFSKMKNISQCRDKKCVQEELFPLEFTVVMNDETTGNGIEPEEKIMVKHDQIRLSRAATNNYFHY